MAGYKSDGIIGGITEGIIAAIDGLVGGLIRLVTGGIAWILEKLGLDRFAEHLQQTSTLQSWVHMRYSEVP